MSGKKVSVIPAELQKHSVRLPNRSGKLRVCAYCRVSTDHEEQQSSYAAQISHYQDYIRQNPGWEFAGIFADEGASGIGTKKRAAFNRMIDACRAGEIDMIIAKSISRFARNTVDCLTYIRQLKELGVSVFFEKENINTLSASGEFVITLLGSLAQEESRSISTNIKWAVERRFSDGKMIIASLYGYDKTDGVLTVNPVTSKNVAKIFTMYMQGFSSEKIAEILTQRRIETPRRKAVWNKSTVNSILKNEKYTGDAILQKYFKPDFLTGKVQVNRGEVKKYYVENSHPPIISKSVYSAVQEEMTRRATLVKKYSSKYALTELVVCGECGSPYRRQVWHAYNPPRQVWRCLNRIEFGKKQCPNSPTIDEYLLENEAVRAIQAAVTPDIRSRLLSVTADNMEKVTWAARAEEIEKALDVLAYDDILIRAVVKRITVLSGGEISVKLQYP